MKLALALSLLAAPSASGFGMEHGDHNDAAVAPGGDEDTYEDTYEEKFDCQDFSQPEEASEDMSDYCKEQEGCYWQPLWRGYDTTGYGYGGECLPGDESMVVMSCEESYGKTECEENPKGCYYNPDDMSCSEDTSGNYGSYEADPNKPTTCGEIDDETICNEEAFVIYFLNCAWQSGAGGAPSYCSDTSGDFHDYTEEGGESGGCDQSVCGAAMFESECGEGCDWMDSCKCPPSSSTGGNTYGGNTYGSDTYGSDSSGYDTDTYNGNPNTYGDSTDGYDTDASNAYAGPPP